MTDEMKSQKANSPSCRWTRIQNISPLFQYITWVRILVLVVLVVLVAVCIPTNTSAAPPAFMRKLIRSGVYLPVGVNIGAEIYPKNRKGFILGGEISGVLFMLDPGVWCGIYTDYLHNFKSNLNRMSTGIELGFTFFGLELGYLGEMNESIFRHGIRTGIIGSVGFVSVYGRYGYLFEQGENHLIEMGVLLKFPIPLWRVPRKAFRKSNE